MIRTRWIRCGWVALAGMVVLAGVPGVAGAAPVEELTKRLPDGVIGFVATSGGDALKDDFAKTSLGRICNDPSVVSFAQAIETQLLAKRRRKAAARTSSRSTWLRAWSNRSSADLSFSGSRPCRGRSRTRSSHRSTPL